MLGSIYRPQLANFTYLEEILGHALHFTLLSLEIVFLLFSLVLLVVILRLSRKKDVFHTNLNICLYYYYILDIVMAFTRLIFLYKEITDSVSPVWQSIFCEVRVYFIVTTLAGMPVILLERACATYFMGKYDKKCRLHIPLICILLPNLLFFGSFPYWTQMKNILPSGIAALTVSLTAFSGYIWLVYYNARRLQRMYDGCSSYSLSNRYQIDENGRVFRIVRNSFFVVSIHFALVPASIIGAFFVQEQKLKTLLLVLGEIFLSTLPIPTILCFIFSTREWRLEIVEFFCGKQTSNKTLPIQTPQGDAYFNHLSKLWNITVVPDMDSADNEK